MLILCRRVLPGAQMMPSLSRLMIILDLLEFDFDCEEQQLYRCVANGGLYNESLAAAAEGRVCRKVCMHTPPQRALMHTVSAHALHVRACSHIHTVSTLRAESGGRGAPVEAKHYGARALIGDHRALISTRSRARTRTHTHGTRALIGDLRAQSSHAHARTRCTLAS